MPKRFLLTAAVAVVSVSPAFAVSTQFFKHGSKAEFEAGKLDNVVVTNFGELKLARAVQDVLKDDASIGSIETMVEGPDGAVYVGTSAGGKVLAVKDGKATTVVDLGEETSVLSLVFWNNNLLIGTGGEQAKVLILGLGKIEPAELVAPEGVQYIWGIHVSADNKAYLATGPNGELIELDLVTKKTRTLLKTEQHNLLSLVGKDDTLYVGTDPDGLVYRVDRKTGQSFVMYDAAETEIGALALDSSGSLYVGTSQAVEVPKDEEEPTPAAETALVGRPVSASLSDPIPGNQPEPPRPLEPRIANALADAPADQPKPEPGEPKPGEPKPGEPKPGEKPAESGNEKPQHSSAGPTQVTATNGENAAAGNAVYRIDPKGFVSEVYRGQVMIFDLALQDGKLLIATGGRGQLMQYDPSTEETVTLAQAKRVFLTSLLATKSGTLLIGTSDDASIMQLSAGLAPTGTATSEVLDAGQIAAFGNFAIHGSLAANSKLTVASRSGNLADPKMGGWSDWSAEIPAAQYVQLASPAARFVQYRLTLSSVDAKTSPVVDDVSLAYQLPNLAPRIDTISVAPAEIPADGSTPSPTHKVDWTATDPNNDTLTYQLYMRTGTNDPWVLLAKDLATTTYEWDTRRVPDGRYELKLEASDASSNAPGTGKAAQRISDPHLVDNTAPAIGDVDVSRKDGKVTIAARVVDRSGIVSSLEYAIDGVEHWQKVLPVTILNDSPEERYTVTLDDPGQSTRVVSLRAKDDSGNVGYLSVVVQPGK
ncbi:MAG: hypothetical protein QM770_17870 [Tepidisphaeraceae bacterium]